MGMLILEKKPFAGYFTAVLVLYDTDPQARMPLLLKYIPHFVVERYISVRYRDDYLQLKAQRV